MFHPIYTTALRHPELIADHLANYAALAREEASQASQILIRRLIAGVLAVVTALMTLVLTGVAIMLYGVNDRFDWLLVIVPAVAALIAIVAALVAARPSPFHSFDELRTQFEADVIALRLAGDIDEP